MNRQEYEEQEGHHIREDEYMPDGNLFRECFEPHLRVYPDCFEECGCDVCEANINNSKEG